MTVCSTQSTIEWRSGVLSERSHAKAVLLGGSHRKDVFAFQPSGSRKRDAVRPDISESTTPCTLHFIPVLLGAKRTEEPPHRLTAKTAAARPTRNRAQDLDGCRRRAMVPVNLAAGWAPKQREIVHAVA